jgi:hypothetical protein
VAVGINELGRIALGLWRWLCRDRRSGVASTLHDRLDAVVGRRCDAEHASGRPEFSDVVVVVADDPEVPDELEG